MYTIHRITHQSQPVQGDKGEGNQDSDAKALVLEIDAAIAYVTESAKLKTPSLV